MDKGHMVVLLVVLGLGVLVGFFLSGDSAARAHNREKLALQDEKLKIEKRLEEAETELTAATKARKQSDFDKKQAQGLLAMETARREEMEKRAKQLDRLDAKVKELDAANRKLQESLALAEGKAVEAAKAVPVVQEEPTEMVKCTACGGGKTVPCDKCDHTGKVLAAKVCPECGGKKTLCPTCGGAGNVTCVPCNGTGKNLDMMGRPVPRRIGPFLYADCALCKGSGRVQCPGARCDKKGFLVCEKCRNRGKITVQEPCQDCSGDGRADCAVCQGTGEVALKK